MFEFVSDLNAAIAKRRKYQRTVSELSSMSLDTALDLNIYRGDIRKIARAAVYGL